MSTLKYNYSFVDIDDEEHDLRSPPPLLAATSPTWIKHASEPDQGNAHEYNSNEDDEEESLEDVDSEELLQGSSLGTVVLWVIYSISLLLVSLSFAFVIQIIIHDEKSFPRARYWLFSSNLYFSHDQWHVLAEAVHKSPSTYFESTRRVIDAVLGGMRSSFEPLPISTGQYIVIRVVHCFSSVANLSWPFPRLIAALCPIPLALLLYLFISSGTYTSFLNIESSSVPSVCCVGSVRDVDAASSSAQRALPLPLGLLAGRTLTRNAILLSTVCESVFSATVCVVLAVLYAPALETPLFAVLLWLVAALPTLAHALTGFSRSMNSSFVPDPLLSAHTRRVLQLLPVAGAGLLAVEALRGDLLALLPLWLFLAAQVLHWASAAQALLAHTQRDIIAACATRTPDALPNALGVMTHVLAGRIARALAPFPRAFLADHYGSPPAPTPALATGAGLPAPCAWLRSTARCSGACAPRIGPSPAAPPSTVLRTALLLHCATALAPACASLLLWWLLPAPQHTLCCVALAAVGSVAAATTAALMEARDPVCDVDGSSCDFAGHGGRAVDGQADMVDDAHAGEEVADSMELLGPSLVVPSAHTPRGSASLSASMLTSAWGAVWSARVPWHVLLAALLAGAVLRSGGSTFSCVTADAVSAQLRGHPAVGGGVLTVGASYTLPLPSGTPSVSAVARDGVVRLFHPICDGVLAVDLHPHVTRHAHLRSDAPPPPSHAPNASPTVQAMAEAIGLGTQALLRAVAAGMVLVFGMAGAVWCVSEGWLARNLALR